MYWRSVRRLLASAGIVGAVALAFSGSAMPVQAADLGTNGVVGPIINFDGQCLDMKSTAADAQVQVEPCDNSSEQQWAWDQAGSGGGFLLVNQRWNRCPTILNHYTGVGGKVTPTTCDKSDTFQQWDPGPPTADGVEISDLADHGFVMHPAVCTNAIGAEIYMNAPDQCRVDFWHG
jgi:Ricin-type beta-trefoil lectin domain